MNIKVDSISIIVAAAGLGTRMQQSFIPKSLVKFNEKSLIDWSIGAFIPYCKNLVIVIRKEHQTQFSSHFSRNSELNVSYRHQERARGTAYAVQAGLRAVETEYSLLVWGDHVGANFFPAKILFQSQKSNNADFILPLVFRKLPYVYFTYSSDEGLLEFNETKKKAPLVKYGLSDCGVFLFRTQPVIRFLDSYLSQFDSEAERDLNFLSLFGPMQKSGIAFEELVFDDERLTYGINSLKELSDLQEIIREDT